MRRLAVALALSIVCLLPSSIALAQSAPEFKLGFRALADKIPSIAGQPIEDEHYGANGDSLQQTTTGLMVWRKADNWTAFTNGSRTWINGPYGVQDRDNNARFGWEKDEPAAPAPTPVPAAPSPQPAPAPQPTAAPQTASAPQPRPTYDADVKAMDEGAGGPGVTVKALMSSLNEEWSRVWGWKPSKPTTIYLYSDGYRMADGISTFTGKALAPTQRSSIARTVAGAALEKDVTTGGYCVVLNVAFNLDRPGWESDMKTVLVHEYTHVMQEDVSGAAGPLWFLEGMAELMAYVRVPDSRYRAARVAAVASANGAGQLPTLPHIEANWKDITSTGSGANLAYGASYLAVKYLADRVGGMPLRQVLEKVAAGTDFNAALSSITGYSVEKLDAEYRYSIPAY